jgi:hypothetical protein
MGNGRSRSIRALRSRSHKRIRSDFDEPDRAGTPLVYAAALSKIAFLENLRHHVPLGSAWAEDRRRDEFCPNIGLSKVLFIHAASMGETVPELFPMRSAESAGSSEDGKTSEW